MTSDHVLPGFAVTIFLAFILSPAVGVGESVALAADDQPAIDWQRLLLTDGERPVIIEDVKNSDGIPGLRASFAVHASREDIWDTLVDYDNFPKFFPQIADMKLLEENDAGATIEFWGDAVLMEIHYVLQRNYVEPGRKVTWLRLSGDLDHVEGSWRIVDGPDAQTHAMIYESFIDVGFTIVTWFVRQGAKREARRMAKALTQWLENGTVK